MGDLSPHFSRWEFDCHDGQIAHPDPELIVRLERLRAVVSARRGVDSPLRVLSGYRDPAYNAKVGGAKDSQHLYNRAADIQSGYATRAEARSVGFRGIGYVGVWAVHVDVRPGPLAEFPDP